LVFITDFILLPRTFEEWGEGEGREVQISRIWDA